MILTGCDQNSLTNSKDALQTQLTQKVQSDTQNVNAKVQVNTITVLDDNTLALDFECHEVTDQQAVKNTLTNAGKNDDISKTIAKSSKNDQTTTTTKSSMFTFSLSFPSSSQYIIQYEYFFFETYFCLIIQSFIYFSFIHSDQKNYKLIYLKLIYLLIISSTKHIIFYSLIHSYFNQIYFLFIIVFNNFLSFLFLR